MHSRTASLPSKIQTKRIPASSFLRLWSLGNSQARIAANYLAYALSKQFVDDDKKQLLQNEFYLKSAVQLVSTMGYLRGAIMKAGQMLANFPQIMPHELTEVFESLQFEAPPMHYSLIREVFLDELNREPEDLFAFFDKQAFAAASLGQVHRARLHNGKEVAVKIQYPNIAATIEADMKAMAFLLQTMRFKKDFKYLCSHIHDAKRVFQREVDYLAEASFMEKNRNVFSGSKVVVPSHYPEFSSKRILTMEYLPGRHLGQFLARNPSADQCNHFAELISYSLVHSWFACKTIYADIHPGNYILMDDGRLGFIDFGCHRQFDEERWKLQMEGEAAMLNGDREALLFYITKLTMHDRPENLDQGWVDRFFKQMHWIIAPIIAKGPFDFADQVFVANGVTLFKELIKNGYVRTDPFYNWSNRALLGHRSLMYRLRARIDYSSLYLEEMQRYS
jgi:predicted unusual protein kinase regulating ubiquinone biosynthesis (AarF/ABC1/UbiB family)